MALAAAALRQPQLIGFLDTRSLGRYEIVSRGLRGATRNSNAWRAAARRQGDFGVNGSREHLDFIKRFLQKHRRRIEILDGDMALHELVEDDIGRLYLPDDCHGYEVSQLTVVHGLKNRVLIIGAR